MNLKKMIFLNTVLTFALCFLTHFLYDWLPNPVFSIFFPVNESIWEHMKMIYTTILLYSLLELFILKKKHLDFNNFTLVTLSKALFAIPIYLIIYLPIYYNFGENMFINFTILFITILIVNIIGYFILKLNPINNEKIVSIIFIILIYIIMTILTYKPPRTDLFFDKEEEKFGINDYLIKE